MLANQKIMFNRIGHIKFYSNNNFRYIILRLTVVFVIIVFSECDEVQLSMKNVPYEFFRIVCYFLSKLVKKYSQQHYIYSVYVKSFIEP